MPDTELANLCVEVRLEKERDAVALEAQLVNDPTMALAPGGCGAVVWAQPDFEAFSKLYSSGKIFLYSA